MATPGFAVKIHSALTAPMLTAGVPRQFFILNMTFLAAITLGMQSPYALPVCIILHFAAVMMAKKDPEFFQVMVRHVRQKSYYGI
ncbi:VirB3 family type IV secretion system protein [Thiotrichales bacterium 19S3-7]|nr:VirB3 family type IV secretion system protein [Thiotrichales bacterium 19S3-7]MCF6802390.1 VirB3 family type IV secretion system protein [Thiotrichales bacterium 19S3-11]